MDATGNLSSTIELSPTQMADIIEPYMNSIIIYAVGERIVRSNCLLDRLHTVFSPSQPFQVTQLGRGFFLLKAPLLSDLQMLLAEYPWSIPNYCLIKLPWVPNFRPSEATITHADVWVRLPELPIEYYAFLSQIIPAIGSLVKIDPETEKQEKCKFARFCVRVDLNSPLVDEIKIGEIRQRVEYEGLEDVLCSQCKRIRHLQQVCSCPHNSLSTITASQEILTSRNGNSSSDRFHRHHHQPRTASGAQQSQVQNQNLAASIRTELSAPSGSRFQPLESDQTASLRSEPRVQLFSMGIQQSVEHQVIRSDTPLEEVTAKAAPTVYTIEPTTKSLFLGVSRSDTGMEMKEKASFWPIPRDSGASQSGPKKLLFWKYNGGGRGKLIQTMTDLKQLHQPSIVLLSGIKISGDDAAQVIEEIGFSGLHRIDPVGFVGGVWLLWHKEDVKIEVHPSTSHKIFAAAHFLPGCDQTASVEHQVISSDTPLEAAPNYLTISDKAELLAFLDLWLSRLSLPYGNDAVTGET